jgi:hypothetical protein
MLDDTIDMQAWTCMSHEKLLPMMHACMQSTYLAGAFYLHDLAATLLYDAYTSKGWLSEAVDESVA